MRAFLCSLADLTLRSLEVSARLLARVNFLRRSKGLAFLPCVDRIDLMLQLRIKLACRSSLVWIWRSNWISFSKFYEGPHDKLSSSYRVKLAQFGLLLLVGDGKNASDGFSDDANLGQLAGSATCRQENGMPWIWRQRTRILGRGWLWRKRVSFFLASCDSKFTGFRSNELQ